MQLQRDVAHRPIAGRHAIEREQPFAYSALDTGKELAQTVAGHQLDEQCRMRICGGQGSNYGTVAQDCDAVADHLHLRNAMRDVDDADLLLFETCDYVEECRLLR